MIAHHRSEKEAEQQAQHQQQYAEPEQDAAPPEEQPAPAEPSMDEKIHDIEALAKLRDSGALTEEEFARQKQQILDG